MRVRVSDAMPKLLLDAADLTVYSIPEDVVSNNECQVLAMEFDTFEKKAVLSYNSIVLSAHFQQDCVDPRSVVFVRLKQRGVFAWASKVLVRHSGEYPIQDGKLGEDFLFLWPVPMAINAYLNFKQYSRMHPNEVNTHARSLIDHPPSMDFVAKLSLLDEGDEACRRVEVQDLTIAQRLFVSSLAPHLSSYPTRAPSDRWCETLRTADERHFWNRFWSNNGGTKEQSLTNERLSVSNGGSRRQAQAQFDLPDDIVERVVRVRIAESMDNLSEMQVVVAQLNSISVQFLRCTRSVTSHMLARVSSSSHSLLGLRPQQPERVRAILWASGVNLRQGLAIPFDWSVYVRKRAEHSARNRAHDAPVELSAEIFRQRQALLWN